MSQKQDMRYHEIFRSKQIETASFCSKFHISTPSHLQRFAVSFLAMQMQTMYPMQPIQPRLVLQQAVLKQPVVSHVRPAQPWLGQLQLPAQVRPAGPMAPAAMPTPVKHMAKLARPLRWVYAAHMQRTQGRTNQVVLPFQQVVSTKVMAPEKELPKEAGCGGDAPLTLRFFGNLASSGFVSQNDQNVNLFQLVLPRPKPQVVSTQVKAPERKELPLIDGQVPKDAGVEGMHPIDFKAFWEQSLFKFLSTCSVLPVGVMGFKRLSHVDLLIRSYGLFVFCCHKTVRSLDFFGMSKLRNQQNMVVVDLRGEDRASGHIAGTVHVPAMDLLKEIQKFVEMFLDQPIVAFMCQYSAHRAPTAAGWIVTTCLLCVFVF